MRNRFLLITCVVAMLAGGAWGQYGGWFWKAGYNDYCPEGMPDFDQTQIAAWTVPGPMGPQWTHCGPVACANSLWWFDSRYETSLNGPFMALEDNFELVWDMTGGLIDDHDPMNVAPLVDDLAYLMDTNGIRSGTPYKGTAVDEMVAGLRWYLEAHGMSKYEPRVPCWFEVVAQPDPSFGFICEEIKLCHDVVLLLGFWQQNPDTWEWTRLGGHYVTVAGVEPDNMIAISDPMLDMMPWGHVPPYPPDLHNDTALVSHDMYLPMGFRFSEYGTPEWMLEDYPYWMDTPYGGTVVENFLGCNPSHYYQDPYPQYVPEWPVVTKIEYAIKVWPNGVRGGRVLDWAGWHLWAPFYKTPWAWPNDFEVYSVDDGYALSAADAAAAGWLQIYIYGNGPTGYITYPGAADPYIYPGFGHWVLTYKPRLRIMAPYHLACGHTCWWRQGPIIRIDHSMP